MKNFSIYTFLVISLAALSIGSTKEVAKIYLLNQHVEGWIMLSPILSTSSYATLHSLGVIFGKKIDIPLLFSKTSFLFISSFSAIFLFTFYGIFIESGLIYAFFESTLYATIFSLFTTLTMKYFYQSNVKRLISKL